MTFLLAFAGDTLWGGPTGTEDGSAWYARAFMITLGENVSENISYSFGFAFDNCVNLLYIPLLKIL